MEAYSETPERYGGFNPKFVERVWAKRRAAMRQAAEREPTPVPAPAPAPVPAPVAVSPRQAVVNLAAKWQLERQADVARILDKYRVLESPGRPSARGIVQRVAMRHSVSYRDIVGVSRQKPVIAARFEAIATVRQLRPDMSSKAIGMLFNRDHTTILHALNRMASVTMQHGEPG